MSRKNRIRTDGGSPLSTNPFAALEGALGDVPPGESAEPPAPAAAPSASERGSPLRVRGKVVVRREKKGRGGKTATVVEGLGLPQDALADMAQQLRRRLGCSAHVEGPNLVVGGAQTTRVRDWLLAQGATKVVVGN